MVLSVTNGGSGPLAKASVLPFTRANQATRASVVRAGAIVGGPRLRLDHLIALNTTGSLNYSAGVKDVNGVWSEWGDSQAHSISNFTAGSTAAAIGSGSTSDLLIDEPCILFPDLSIGSGLSIVTKTVVGDGFFDETRAAQWQSARAAFSVEFTDLDQDQTLMLQKFFQTLNGPFKPFYFEFLNPMTQLRTKHVVRFREPTMAMELFDCDRSSATFVLIEVMGASANLV